MVPAPRPETPRRWEAVADGPLADRALESAARIAEVLAAEAGASRSGCSLPEGSAGTALALAYLSRCLSRPSLLDGARRAWDVTLEGLAAPGLSPALHGGFTGPAWVDAHIGELILGSPTDNEVHAEIEGALIEQLEASPNEANFELISGLVGFGVYALERWPDGRSPQLLELVVDRLAAGSEAVEGGVAWTTPPGRMDPLERRGAPGGYRNLGVAHGIPGIVALLGRASGVGALSSEGGRVLEGAVSWLLASQRRLPDGLRYAFGLPLHRDPQEVERHASRVAWCYGDLGVAAVLCLAGQSHGRPDWIREGVALAVNCTAVPAERTGVRDHGLCHGSAGLVQIFARMANATGDERLRDTARNWVAWTLDSRAEGPGIDGYLSIRPANAWAVDEEQRGYHASRDSGFLMGAAGVALALAASASASEPSWDRVLLLSDRPPATDCQARPGGPHPLTAARHAGGHRGDGRSGA